jgi:hypothetical protein
MTPKQEIIMTLFTKETIDKVKEQFKNGKEIIAYESFDMNFRLFKPTASHINLEFFARIPVETVKEQDLSGVGNRARGMVSVLKPIGFFSQKKGFSSNGLEVTVLKEFEDDLNYLIELGKIDSNLKINKLSLEENALLAAFSVEALFQAEKYQDCSFNANGLDMDIYMTLDGEYPQSFLNDRYGLSGHIGAYFLRDENRRIDMNTSYKDLYWDLFKMSLMTAYKII